MRETAKKLSDVGTRIDVIRVKNGLGLVELATRAKINYSQLYRLMHGESRPSRDSLLRVCRALGCSLGEAAHIFDATEFRAPDIDDLNKIKNDVAAK